MTGTAVEASVDAILSRRGLRPSAVPVQIRGGANNRVFRVDTEQGDAFLAKHYFREDARERDRFGAERSFYDLLWGGDVRSIPEPIGWDPDSRIGVFEFVGGRKLEADEVGEPHVAMAARFLAGINAPALRQAAASIPAASEACFSIETHIACVDGRVRRLLDIDTSAHVDREAAAWIRDQLVPTWRRIRDEALDTAGQAGMRTDTPIDPEERILSPSDFGFHNGLMTPDGNMRFFDFEYAGWDDPAKTLCDFFCQPQVRVSLAHRPRFVDALARSGIDAGTCAARAALLLPVYRVKWCCIMLNEFVGADLRRRQFSAGGSVDALKRAQLERASAALATCVADRKPSSSFRV